MKKMLVFSIMAVMLLTASAALAQDFGGAIKLSVDFAGNHETGIWNGAALVPDSKQNKAGFTVHGEVYIKPTENIDVGGGIQWQISRERKNLPGKFWWVPIYGVIRIHPKLTEITPYAIAQVGYNFFGADNTYLAAPVKTNGGLYWGVGGGLIFMRQFLLEVMYSENWGSVNAAGTSVDVKNERISVALGYNFE